MSTRGAAPSTSKAQPRTRKWQGQTTGSHHRFGRHLISNMQLRLAVALADDSQRPARAHACCSRPRSRARPLVNSPHRPRPADSFDDDDRSAMPAHGPVRATGRFGIPCPPQGLFSGDAALQGASSNQAAYGG